MRILSLTFIFRVVVSTSLPSFSSFNRLTLHAAGLSPNSRFDKANKVSVTSDFAVVSKDEDFTNADECTASTSEVPDSPFPSLTAVFDCRGGHSMSPMDDSLKPFPPFKLLGVDLSLFGLKLLLQLGLTLLNVGCWWIPMRTKSFSQNENMLALANTFSAGIFLMLAFSHLIPHALHTLEAANINPLITLQAVIGGYLLMFAVEKLLFDGHSIMHSVMDDSSPIRRPSIIGNNSTNEAQMAQSSFESNYTDVSEEKRSRSGSVISQHSAIVLLLAMAVHSLFETIALGMAPDSTSALIMATSVALHQPAESLALLVAFLKTSMSKSAIIRWLGLFSIVGPFGVFLGRFIQALATPLLEGLLVAMTAGTFLYVGMTDIVPESFEDSVSKIEKWKRFAALVSGIGSILLIGGHDDQHSH